MTNHWIDIGNSDCIMVIGANPAENHPAGFGWVTKAKERGAKVISVDPRFTRTSSKADIYAQMRSGTDIAFIGGMIKYILDDIDRRPANYNMVYVTEYTNASFLINPDFKGAADLDGLFSGYDPNKRSYDKSTWQYQLDEKGIPKKDKTLQDPKTAMMQIRSARLRGRPREPTRRFVRRSPLRVSPGRRAPLCMPWAPPSILMARRISGAIPYSSFC